MFYKRSTLDGGRMLSRLTDIAVGRRARTRVRWFSSWCDELDTALGCLPEMETCPHALFRALMLNPTASRKIAAIVSEDDRPIALFGLRRRNRHWEPVAELSVPNALAPALPGRLFDALAALRTYVRIPDWGHPIPHSAHVRELEFFPTYRVSTDTDFDALWRELRNTDRVRKARNRCGRLGEIEFEIDHPDAAAWTIGNWGGKWSRPYSDISAAAADMQVAAAYLTPRGEYHAFRLLHRGIPVAGTNWFAHGDTLTAHCSHRDPAYDGRGVGVRLDELFFRWSATSPYRVIDLGGEFDYKAKWAREGGVHANFSVMPAHLALAKSGLTVARRLARVASAAAAIHRPREQIERSTTFVSPELPV